MNPDSYSCLRFVLLAALLISNMRAVFGQFADNAADLKALPKVPLEFEVTLFASEPLVRQQVADLATLLLAMRTSPVVADSSTSTTSPPQLRQVTC